MALVGDIIMQLRRRIPDAPSVLSQSPAIVPSSIYPVIITGGQFPSNANLAIVVTAATPWGETLPSSEVLFTMSGSYNAIQITVQVPPAATITALNFYVGFYGAGTESFVLTVPAIIATQQTVVIGTVGPAATPPTRNTAFMPDTDGNFISAHTAYNLLNEANKAMVKICGGIVDVTGVRSVVNTSMYRLASPFYQFVNAWYDGYPMDIVPRSFMYLRNSAAGFSGILSYEQDGPQSVVQVWPQSNRMGGTTSLQQDMAATDVVFITPTGTTTSGAAGFLSIGLVQVDQEIMGYSVVNPNGPTTSTFSGLVRGLGGTLIVEHNQGAPVTELNIRLSGYRLAPPYLVGQSNLTFMVPQAWEESLVLHMLAQVRSMEQDDATANQLMQAFIGDAEKIAKGSRLGRMKPRQIPIWGQNNTDARNVNGIGFGWLIN